MKTYTEEEIKEVISTLEHRAEIAATNATENKDPMQHHTSIAFDSAAQLLWSLISKS